MDIDIKMLDAECTITIDDKLLKESAFGRGGKNKNTHKAIHICNAILPAIKQLLDQRDEDSISNQSQ